MIRLTTEQAQQIEESLEDIVRVFKFETGTPVEALAAIRAARAQEQAEQEPVGVVEGSGEWGIAGVLVAGVPIGTKLYAAPVSIQNESETDSSSSSMRTTVRTKDLTDDEVLECGGMDAADDWAFDFARAVIAADREKNK